MATHCDEFVPVKIETSITIKEEVLDPLTTSSLTETQPHVSSASAALRPPQTPKTPAQRQREYRLRLKEKKANAVWKQTTAKSNAERQREYRKRQKSKRVVELFSRALREFQHKLPPELHQSEQDKLTTTECLSLTTKQEVPDPLMTKQEVPDTATTASTEANLKVSSPFKLLFAVPTKPRNPKSNAQRQREYRLRKALRKIAVNRNRPTPKTGAERQRDCRQRQKAKKAAQTSTSRELTTSSIGSKVKQAEFNWSTEWTPTMDKVKKFFTDNNVGHACSVCNKLWFDNVLTFMTAEQIKVVSEWFDKENLQFCRDEFEVVCETCKYSLDEGSMPVLAKVNGFSYPEILPGLPLDPISERLISPRMPYREVFCESDLVVQQPEYLVLSEKWMRHNSDAVPIKNYECISRVQDETDSNVEMESGVSIYRKVSSTGDFSGDVTTAGDVCLIEIAFNTADPHFNFVLGAVYVRTASCVRDVEQLLQQALFSSKQNDYYESPFLFVDPNVPSLGCDEFETFDAEDDS